MKNFENLLDSYSTIEKRSILYYLSRYIKQAKAFEHYKKDLFEDGTESTPNEEIKSLTLKMIEFIESTANKKASEFNEEEFLLWMDAIAEAEDSIDIEPDEEIIQKALAELNRFDVPKISKTDS